MGKPLGKMKKDELIKYIKDIQDSTKNIVGDMLTVVYYGREWDECSDKVFKAITEQIPGINCEEAIMGSGPVIIEDKFISNLFPIEEKYSLAARKAKQGELFDL